MAEFFVCISLHAQTAEISGLESLKTNNPFGSAPETDKQQPVSVRKNSDFGEVLLQGIAFVDGKWMFSLASAKDKKSIWVELGETRMDFTVRAYDQKSGAVEIAFKGENRTIGLKSMEIPTVPLAPAEPAASAAPPAEAPPPPPPSGGGRVWRDRPPMSIEDQRRFLEFGKKRLEKAEADLKAAEAEAAKK